MLQPILDAFRSPQRKATLILLSAPILMLAWKYFGSPEYLAGRFADAGSEGHWLGTRGAVEGRRQVTFIKRDVHERNAGIPT